MVIGILKEQYFNRVSIAPSSSKKLDVMGLTRMIEKGAGEKAGFSDELYHENGFTSTSRESVLTTSDIIVSIAPVTDSELGIMKKMPFIYLCLPHIKMQQYWISLAITRSM